MPSFVNNIVELSSSPAFSFIQIAVLSYFGLLWLSIIIWVTRDSINRSNSLIFQTFAILINIAVPILGVLLYLIIRPGKTNTEKYYEEIEHRILTEGSEEKTITCENCMTLVDKEYVYCPNCGEKVKKACDNCKKEYPSVYSICPYCGKEDENQTGDKKKPVKRRKTSVKSK